MYDTHETILHTAETAERAERQKTRAFILWIVERSVHCSQ